MGRIMAHSGVGRFDGSWFRTGRLDDEYLRIGKTTQVGGIKPGNRFRNLHRNVTHRRYFEHLQTPNVGIH